MWKWSLSVENFWVRIFQGPCFCKGRQSYKSREGQRAEGLPWDHIGSSSRDLEECLTPNIHYISVAFVECKSCKIQNLTGAEPDWLLLDSVLSDTKHANPRSGTKKHSHNALGALQTSARSKQRQGLSLRISQKGGSANTCMWTKIKVGLGSSAFWSYMGPLPLLTAPRLLFWWLRFYSLVSVIRLAPGSLTLALIHLAWRPKLADNSLFPKLFAE